MSLDTRVQAVVERIATEVKNNKVKVGTLTNLTTSANDNLVNAINELVTLVNTKASTTDLNTAIADLINGADTENDTLKELADKIAALVQADNGLVSAVGTQTFTDPQKAQARSNIGAVSQTDYNTLVNNVGNTNNDYVSVFDGIYNA